MEAILTTLLGAILAIGTTITIESMRRPKLSITITPPNDKDFTPPPQRPARHARFLYVSVGNLALPWYARWMARGAAVDTWGTISFHHLDGQNVFGRAMSVRWSGSTEPPIAAAGGTILDPSWLHSLNRRDIQTGESEPIDIAARFDDEASCYGWSNESYFCDPMWRNKRWQLPKGRYLVLVMIYASGQRVTQSFRLSNEGPRDGFRLEPPQRDDDQKIRLNLKYRDRE